MAVTQKFLSMDDYFRASSGDKIIINDLNKFSVEDINKVNSSLMTVYNNTDTLSTIPSCDCGSIKGRYRIGHICQECGTKCKEVHEKVEPLLWLKTLDVNVRFLNPDYWLMLSKAIDKKIDYLRWMCDPKYNPPVELPAFMYGVKEILGDVRTYTNTISKIPDIIEYLLNHSKFKEIDKQEVLTLLLDMYKTKQREIFSDFLPIVNKKLFVMENTTKGKFVNLAVSDVIGVVMLWINAASEEKQNDKKINANTSIVISKLAQLYHSYFEKYVVQKIGIFRKHVYGARSHFTFRSVITSIPGRHLHSEIHVPWGIGVTAFKPHILNKLVKRGYTYIKASNMLYTAVKKFDPVINEILNELIAESPYIGIPCIAQRNQ